MKAGHTAFAFVVIVILALAGRPALAKDIGEMVVVFDQSGSMERYDPTLASKLWLTTFLRTFTTPHRIVLTGFDEKVHEHIAITTDDPVNMATLAGELDRISARGLATDIETPFRYLLERGGHDAVKLVLIISDGVPEIWDERLEYLSRSVLADPRYDELNRKYKTLLQEGMSKQELFDRLGTAYHERNIALAEGHLPELARVLGGRIIIWDLSGRSFFLKSMARMAGAQYIPMRVVGHVDPVAQLRGAMLLLQKRASEMVAEPLPADAENRVDTVMSTLSGTPPQAQPAITAAPEKIQETPAPEPIQTPPPPEPAAPEPPAEPLEPAAPTAPDHGIGTALWVAILVLTVALVVLLIRRRRQPNTTVVSPAGGSDDRLAVHEASSFIDGSVRGALSDAEQLRRRLMAEETRWLENERRFAVRVPVPAGAMTVYWTNRDGVRHEGNVVNISMRGVLFEAAEFDTATIDRVVCPRFNIALNVTDAAVQRRETDRVVVVMVEFEDNVDSWMAWTELITRIEEE